jgi:ADP-heptose:LPS heptosyltransferase
MPDAELVFACPKSYHDLVKDHPCLDEVIDSASVNKGNYLVSYDISTCCISWECANAPFASKHRSDIWAEHCGVMMTKHDMHLPFIDNETIQEGYLQVMQHKKSFHKYDKKSANILFAPISFEKVRTLTDEHIVGVVNHLRNNGHFVYSTHTSNVDIFEKLGVPVLIGRNMKQWFSLIHAADYVISADTSVFHYAGGIKKPLVGIFTHADGKYRGKYFDFILVQKHRDNGDWPCGPCYNYGNCTNPRCKNPSDILAPKPCLTELTVKDITDGIDKMFNKWPK